MAASITTETIYERRASDDQFREQFAQVHSYCKQQKVEASDADDVSEVDVEKDDNPIYCICRTADTSRFMIGCDNCNEWYHGDCISITEQYAQNILKFYCLLCRNKNPSLKNVYKKAAETKRKAGCGQCAACWRKDDCQKCDNCKQRQRFGSSLSCLKRICTLLGNTSGTVPAKNKRSRKPSADDSDQELSSSRRKTTKKKSNFIDDEDYVPEVSRGGRGRGRKAFAQYPRQNRRAQARSSMFEFSQIDVQCFGTGCTKSARPGSKYCSDECGIRLARDRIFSILPERIKEWQSTPCRADEVNRKLLENIRKQQQAAKEELQKLEDRKVQLEELIEKGKATPLEFTEDPSQTEEDCFVYCITCGHEVNARTAIRHMERCFMRFEGQTSYGSIYKTRIGSQVFCDAYNSAQKTYCKRLKVLCPEHTKEPKVSETEVCGCPLYEDVFRATGKYCSVAKKKCMRHYCWEKFRRAEIDMEVVRLWLKLDELLEQERNNRLAITNRGGVLGLLLHHTISHSDTPSSYSNNSNQS